MNQGRQSTASAFFNSLLDRCPFLAQTLLREIDRPVDIVDIFRPSAEAPDVARQAVKIKAKVLWLQLGML